MFSNVWQCNENAKQQIIEFYSKKLKDVDMNQTVFEVELLAYIIPFIPIGII